MQRITIGLATILGTLGAAAGVLIPLIGELAGAAEPLGVTPQVWVIVGAVLAVAVVLGRMSQAVAQTIHEQPVGPDDLVDPPPTEASDLPA